MEQVEQKTDIETEESGVVKRWLREKKLADKRDKQWCHDVEDAIDVYRNQKFQGEENEDRKETFNILWSNIETKRPVLYSTTPRPDIRRRFKDKSPLAANISELLERASSFTFESSNLDAIMIAAVNDMLLPGRAITRVKYVPTLIEVEVLTEQGPALDQEGNPLIEEQIAYEEIEYEQWQWDKFRIGPCANWQECPWILFIHNPTKDQAEEKWPEFADKLKYEGHEPAEKKGEKSKENEPSSDDGLFKTTEVWEIWDKETREVIWVAPSYKESVLDRVEDPMGFADFWPIPEPLLAIESSTSTTPQTEYSMYETLAKELEIATNRIKRLLKGLRARGVYNSLISEMEQIFEEDDNGFIPANNAEPLLEQGLDNAIWMLPIDKIVQVLMEVKQYRLDLIQQIYEITGISDIFRGVSNPHETRGAQEIKATFGTKRLERQQKEVQRYARDLLRLTVEKIAEFQRDTLTLMTGLNFPTQMEKQQAEMAAQQAEQLQQPPDPQLQSLLDTPSWEEIEDVLQSDIKREYLIDIETNSTIEVNETEDKENMQKLFTAMVQMIQALGPAVQMNIMDQPTAKALIGTVVRRFKFGREVEDALENMPQQEQGPSPEQVQQQQEQQKFELEMQKEQLALQREQQKAQAEMRQTELDMIERQKEHEYRMAEMARKDQMSQRDFDRKRAESVN